MFGRDDIVDTRIGHPRFSPRQRRGLFAMRTCREARRRAYRKSSLRNNKASVPSSLLTSVPDIPLYAMDYLRILLILHSEILRYHSFKVFTLPRIIKSSIYYNDVNIMHIDIFICLYFIYIFITRCYIFN